MRKEKFEKAERILAEQDGVRMSLKQIQLIQDKKFSPKDINISTPLVRPTLMNVDKEVIDIILRVLADHLKCKINSLEKEFEEL